VQIFIFQRAQAAYKTITQCTWIYTSDNRDMLECE